MKMSFFVNRHFKMAEKRVTATKFFDGEFLDYETLTYKLCQKNDFGESWQGMVPVESLYIPA